MTTTRPNRRRSGDNTCHEKPCGWKPRQNKSSRRGPITAVLSAGASEAFCGVL